MQIHFTGHQLEITTAIKSFTEEKFQKLKKHYQDITNVNVVFAIEKLSQIAEATIHLPHKYEVHAREESSDLYAAIDGLVDKLDRQLLKHKEKLQDHRE